MSALGQFRKSALATARSAFPPIATKLRTSREVRFVPIAEVMPTRTAPFQGSSSTPSTRITSLALILQTSELLSGEIGAALDRKFDIDQSTRMIHI
jgi:hypothetical protein